MKNGLTFNTFPKTQNIIETLKNNEKAAIIIKIDSFYQPYSKKYYNKLHKKHNIYVKNVDLLNKVVSVIEEEYSDSENYVEMKFDFNQIEEMYYGYVKNFYDTNKDLGDTIFIVNLVNDDEYIPNVNKKYDCDLIAFNKYFNTFKELAERENIENITIAIRLKKFRLELVNDIEQKEFIEKQINYLNKMKKALVKKDERMLSNLIDDFMSLELKLFLKSNAKKKVVLRDKERFYYKIGLENTDEIKKNNISFVSDNYLFMDRVDVNYIEDYNEIILNNGGYIEVLENIGVYINKDKKIVNISNKEEIQKELEWFNLKVEHINYQNNSINGYLHGNKQKFFFKILSKVEAQNEIIGYLTIIGKLPVAELLRVIEHNNCMILMHEFDKTIGNNVGLLNDLIVKLECEGIAEPNSIIYNVLQTYVKNWNDYLYKTNYPMEKFYRSRVESRLVSWYKSSDFMNEKIVVNDKYFSNMNEIINDTKKFFSNNHKERCVLTQGDPNLLNIGLKPIFFDYCTSGYNSIHAEIAAFVWSEILADAYFCPKYHQASYYNHDNLLKQISIFKPEINVVKKSEKIFINVRPPKGVQITYENLFNFFDEIKKVLPIDNNDILLTITTISFDISIMEMFLPLMIGATVVIGNKRMLIDMEKLKNAILENDITVLQATPVTWAMLTSKEWENETNIKIFCGGEKLEKQLAEKLINISNNVWNLYGPTETTIWSSVKKIDNKENISIGKPLNNINYYIFDSSMKASEEGELYIGGKCVAKGYLNNEELTDQRFIKNPLNFKEIIYKTGDIVRKKENEYYYVGRNDFQIKLNGHRIELEEIENSIRTLDGIKDAVVVPNQTNRSIIAFVLVNKNIDNLKEYVTDRLTQRLPRYMVPHFVERVDVFPTTFNNKIDRKELLKVYTSKNSNVKDKKEVLLEIWKKFLKCEVTEDTTFDIYELDSLEFVKLCAEMNNVGVNVSLSQLFEYKTIREILKNINKENKTDEVEKIFLNEKLQKKIKKYNVDLKDIKVKELNEIENMMLMYYLFNRNSDIFYESYSYVIDKDLNNDFILENFIKVFSNVESLNSLYYFNVDKKNLKVFSKKFNLIRKNIIKCNSNEEFIEFINKKRNVIYGINDFSIEINIVEFKNKKYLIINYHHIRMDGNKFYENLLISWDKLYRNYSTKEHEIISPLINTRIINIENSEGLRLYCKENKTRVASLLQFLIAKAIMKKFNYTNYDIVINNVPRKSDNDISIKKIEICNNFKEQQKIIDKAIRELEDNKIDSKEHDILIIINNKQEIYDRMKKYNITEEHIERNNYKFIFTVNLQEKIQISLDCKRENSDMYENVKQELKKFMEENIK